MGMMIQSDLNVDLGSRERVFPDGAGQHLLEFGSTPYDTINLGIQTLAKSLLEDLSEDERFKTKEGKKRVRTTPC